jgi:exodeoxyribonuclease VII large subunit
MSLSAAQPNSEVKTCRLRQITGRLRAILLEKVQDKRFWVRAQLVVGKGGLKAGHCYCELVDSDEDGEVVAKMRAVIWRSKYELLNRKCTEAGHPDALTNNQEVCVYCSVVFHEVHGLSLEIHDVDPCFGEGHIDRNRRVILEGLKRDGLLDRNKQINVPAAPLRIGLITAAGSAAFSDFHKTLATVPFGFKVVLAVAAMQGERTEEEVLTALLHLFAVEVDVICIVRGGGSQLDLAWFDKDKLARAIASSAVPVWVGIGHEIDFGVLDWVAHTSFKTPTAVAEELVRRVTELDDRLLDAAERLQFLTQRRLDLRSAELQRKIVGLLQGTRKHFAQQQSWLRERVLRTVGTFERQFTGRRGKLHQAHVMLEERSQRRLAEREEKLGRAIPHLQEAARRCLARATIEIERRAVGLRRGCRKHLALGQSQLQVRSSQVRAAVTTSTNRKASALDRRSAILLTRLEYMLRNRLTTLEAIVGRVVASAWRNLGIARDGLARRQGQFTVARFANRLTTAEQRVDDKQKRLESLRPERLLQKGYSITRDLDGKLVRSVEQLSAGQRIETEFADGRVQSIIEKGATD